MSSLDALAAHMASTAQRLELEPWVSADNIRPFVGLCPKFGRHDADQGIITVSGRQIEVRPPEGSSWSKSRQTFDGFAQTYGLAHAVKVLTENIVPGQFYLPTIFSMGHHVAFRRTDDGAGLYREHQTNIGSLPAVIESEVQEVLERFDANSRSGTFDPAEHAVRLHVELVTIHPFQNGNGRWTRVYGEMAGGLMDPSLPLFGWSMRTITDPLERRSTYLHLLRTAAKNLDTSVSRLVEFALAP